MAVKEITTVTRPNVDVSWHPTGTSGYEDTTLGGQNTYSDDGLTFEYTAIINNKQQWREWLAKTDTEIEDYTNNQLWPHRIANNIHVYTTFIDLTTSEEIDFDEIINHLPD